MLPESSHTISLIKETIEDYQNEHDILLRTDPVQSSLRLQELTELIAELERSLKAFVQTPEPSKQARLEEIKERFASATPGNWKVYQTDEGPHIGTAHHHAQLKSPTPVVSMSNWRMEPTKRIYINDADAIFISNAKEDIRWLIQQIDFVIK